MIESKKYNDITYLKVSSISKYFVDNFGIKRYDMKIARSAELSASLEKIDNRSKWMPTSSLGLFFDLVGAKETDAVHDSVKGEFAQYLPVEEIEESIIEVEDNIEVEELFHIEESSILQPVQGISQTDIEAVQTQISNDSISQIDTETVQPILENETDFTIPVQTVQPEIKARANREAASQESVQSVKCDIEVVQDSEIVVQSVKDEIEVCKPSVKWNQDSVQTVKIEMDVVQEVCKEIEPPKIEESDNIVNSPTETETSKSLLVKVFTSLEFVFVAMSAVIFFVAFAITAPAMRDMNISYWWSICGSLSFDISAMVSILYGRLYVSYVFVGVTSCLLAVRFSAFETAENWIGFVVNPKGFAITVAGTMAMYVYSELFIEKMNFKIESK